MLFDGLDDYQSALAENDDAIAEFKFMQSAYRSQQIDDAEYLAARVKYDSAMAKYDRAYSAAADFERGRCADCTSHAGSAECANCEFEHSTDAYSPAMIGAADMSYLPRLEAERITAEWKTKSARRPSDLTEAPLFGGKRQGEMFS
jgi:hypothetical protein